MIEHLDPWPFINGAYGISVLFLAGTALLTWRRLRQAAKRLVQTEAS